MSILMNEWAQMKQSLINQIQQRGLRASNAICEHAKEIVSGPSPSSPGSPPGLRTGNYRSGFSPKPINTANGVTARAENNVFYGAFLEYGTSKMAPRPHVKATQNAALPDVTAIFQEDYSL